VETRIGRAPPSGEIYDEATMTLDADGDELTATWRNPEPEEAVEPGTVEAVA
jgi:hypothetical protein